MFGFFKKKENIQINTLKEEPNIDTNVVIVEGPTLSESAKTLVDEDRQLESGNIPVLTEEVQVQTSQLIEPQIDMEPQMVEEKSSKELELESHIGKLVICLSDQNEPPRVCVGVEVVHITRNKIPMLSVYDIVKREKSIPWGIIFDYTDQKFDALNNMDANARTALFFHRLGGEIIDRKPDPKMEGLTPDEWKKEVGEAIERINQGIWT